MNKRIICMLLVLVLALGLCACGGEKAEQAEQAEEAPVYTYLEPGQKLRHAEITIRDYGTVKVELDEGVAPITVENFVALAKEGFYDWHDVDMQEFAERVSAPYWNMLSWEFPKEKAE
jgi:peptidyl-prolyl cis-trans isomerase B (cyclophilin B)